MDKGNSRWPFRGTQIKISARTREPPPATSALPADWQQLWEEPTKFHRAELRRLQGLYKDLSAGLDVTDLSGILGSMVAPTQNATEPIHRWYP